jgi:hypothetical protein
MMRRIVRCGGCSFNRNEDILGNAWCELYNAPTNVAFECFAIRDGGMSEEVALKVLHTHQKYRRGARIPLPNTTIVGEAIDVAIRTLRNKKK